MRRAPTRRLAGLTVASLALSLLACAATAPAHAQVNTPSALGRPSEPVPAPVPPGAGARPEAAPTARPRVEERPLARPSRPAPSQPAPATANRPAAANPAPATAASPAAPSRTAAPASATQGGTSAGGAVRSATRPGSSQPAAARPAAPPASPQTAGAGAGAIPPARPAGATPPPAPGSPVAASVAGRPRFALPPPPRPPAGLLPHQAEAAPGQPPAPSAASLVAPAQAAPVAGALRPPQRPEGRRGDNTGLPLPRFASLRAERVNLRAGPGSRFRVEWTYVRRDLPVEIVREHDVWRRVRDPEGVEGWVHQQMLSGRRTFLVRGAERALRRAPSDNAAEVARLAPGVIGQFRRCAEPSDWCEVQAAGHRGYLRRGEVWGIYAGEAVD